GGQNVYVAEVAVQLSLLGYQVDIYTRAEDPTQDEIVYWKPNIRVIHIVAGPIAILPKEQLYDYMTEFSSNMISFIEDNHLQYHLVHAHFWLSGMVAIDVKKQL